MVETHDCLRSMDNLRALQAALGERPAKILWDSHHTWKRGSDDALETWEALRPYVEHVHFKDSIALPASRGDFFYVPPGAGEFPLSSLFERLRRDGFSGPVSFEWERQWHPTLTALEEVIPALAQWMAPCL